MKVTRDIQGIFDTETGQLIGVAQKDGAPGQSAVVVPVTAQVNDLTGGVAKLWSGTQAQYDAIAVKDDYTLYIIVAG